MIEKKLKVTLPQDEAAFIALHIVNAELDLDMTSMVSMTKFVNHILDIVDECFGDRIDKESVFYERPIQFLKQTNSSFIQKWNPKSFSFQHLNMRMGNVTFSNTEIFYMKNMGDFINENDLKQGKPIHIGTIGADLFQNKVVIIDYKSTKLAITDSVPSQYASLPSVKFTIDNGIIKLPFSINGQECPMMFDTGSSPFQLVTTKERALNIANPTIVDSLSGPLWWGKEITFYGLNVTKTIEFAGEKRPENSMVFYDKDGLWANIFNAFIHLLYIL